MVLRVVVDVRGNSTPLLALFTSSMELGWGSEPSLLIATLCADATIPAVVKKVKTKNFFISHVLRWLMFINKYAELIVQFIMKLKTGDIGERSATLVAGTVGPVNAWRRDANSNGVVGFDDGISD